jgi:hypothetical protein
MKALRSKAVVAWAAILLVCTALVTLCGCSPAPIIGLTSLDEVKGYFVDDPDVRFPDLTSYEGLTIGYNIVTDHPDRSVVGGYGISIFGDMYDTHYNAISTTDGIFFDCYTSYYYSKRMPIVGQPQLPTTNYRGLTVKNYSGEMSESYAKGPDNNNSFPEGTFAYSYRYIFELDGYYYLVDSRLILTPDEQATQDIEAEKAKAEADAWALIDSLLEWGSTS